MSNFLDKLIEKASAKKMSLSTILLVLILLLGAFFRFKGLSTRDIWYDEALDVLQAERSIVQISQDVATPIHYYFVHFFLRFGKNTFTLGLPSVVFGLGSIFLLYLIGKKIAGKRLGLIVAFLLALSPMHIEFSQQILHYSYFVFFCLLSLYFYLEFLLSFNEKKIRWKSFLLFLFFTCVNILTHVSAFLVAAIEGIFFIFFLLFDRRVFLQIKKYLLPLVFLLIFLAFPVVLFGQGYYKDLFLENLSFGVNKPMEIGYSLSKQLDSTILQFNYKFFAAMFSWFGLGEGERLYIYFSLFVLGISFFVLRKKILVTLFMLHWIFFPFVYLYFVKTGHWFEEKYFIFIIPIYLVFIASGIIFLAELLTSLFIRFLVNLKFLKQVFILTVLVVIFYCSIIPIKTRTTFGYPVKGYLKYNWRKVCDYMRQVVRKNDRVFVRKGEGLFLDFYFGKEKKNTFWFEEDYILNLGPKEYIDFASEENQNYYISISEFYDNFLAGAADYQFIDKVGNFNVYKIKFRKSSPFVIKANQSGRWEYYDDFRTARYFAETSTWNNITTTYMGNFNLPMTYGYYNLSPTNFTNANIDYHFILPKGTRSFYIKPLFALEKGVSFKIFVGEDEQKSSKVYEKRAEFSFYFNPLIKAYKPSTSSSSLFLRFAFEYPENSVSGFGESNLKSIWMFNRFEDSVAEYETKVDDNHVDYFYDSQLEVTKSNKWLHHTTENFGWIQATDGILFRHFGDEGKNPLVYKFNFKSPVEQVQLKIKTYTFNNEMSIYFSKSGDGYTLLKRISDNTTNTHQVLLNDLETDKLFIKFVCKESGPECQLRDIKLKAKIANF